MIKTRYSAIITFIISAAAASGTWAALWFSGFTFQEMALIAAGSAFYVSFIRITEYDEIHGVDYIQTAEGPAAAFMMYCAVHFFTIAPAVTFFLIVPFLIAQGSFLRLLSDRDTRGVIACGTIINAAVIILTAYMVVTDRGFNLPLLVLSCWGALPGGEVPSWLVWLILIASAASAVSVRFLGPLGHLYSHGPHFMSLQGKKRLPAAALFPLLRSVFVAGTVLCIGLRGFTGLYLPGSRHVRGTPLASFLAATACINAVSLAGRFVPARYMIILLFAASYAAFLFYRVKRSYLYDRV